MMNKLATRLLTIVTILLLAGTAFAAQAGKPPKGMGKYLITLWHPGTPVPGKKEERMKRVPEPDVAQLGGQLVASDANRRVVFLPYAAAQQLRKHEAVASVQRLFTGEPFAEWNETEPAAPRRPAITSDSDTFTWDRNYTYDADGNITNIGNDEFTYDGVGRLESAIVGGSAENYTYDGFGNLIAVLDAQGGRSIPVDPATNRMTGNTYDAAGNVTSRDQRGAYAWDSLNMLIAAGATPGPITPRRILYDANDERIGTMFQNLHRWTIRDFSGQIVREFSGHGGTLSLTWSWEQDHIRGEGQLVAGETPVWNHQSAAGSFSWGGKRHYHLDHLGSVRVVTTQQGKSLTENDYYPFGNPRSKQHQEDTDQFDLHTDGMRFAGHWRDFMGQRGVEDDNYLDYMHARYYDPNLGRFLSTDTYLDIAKAQRMPQMWNRYAYVANNPVSNTDPTGKAFWTTVGKAAIYVARYNSKRSELIIARIHGGSKKQVMKQIREAIDGARAQGGELSVITPTSKQRDGIAAELSSNGRARGPERSGLKDKPAEWPTHMNPEEGPYSDIHVQTLSDTKKKGFGSGLLSIVAPATMRADSDPDATPTEIISAALWDTAKAIDPIFLTDGLEYVSGLNEYVQPPEEP